MDQGTAAVIAAGFGIVGTLGGALGGAWFASRTALRQVGAQEAADFRHQLRDERRTAFAAVLDRSDAVTAALNPVIAARIAPDADTRDDWRSVWDPVNEALASLLRAVTTLAITGPDEVYHPAVLMHVAQHRSADSMRRQLPFDQGAIEFATANRARDDAREDFIVAARLALSEPGLITRPGSQ